VYIDPQQTGFGLCSVLHPRQHSIGYTGDSFYRSKDPTNSIKVLKEMLQRKKAQLSPKTEIKAANLSNTVNHQ